VKDITDTNRITSKLQRDKKESYLRGRQYEHHDKFASRGTILGQKSTIAPPPKQGGGEEQNPEVSVLTDMST